MTAPEPPASHTSRYCLHQERSFQQILHPLACSISGTTALGENGCCVVTSQEEWTKNMPGSMDQVSANQNVVIIPHFSTCLYCHSLSLLLFDAFLNPRGADLLKSRLYLLKRWKIIHSFSGLVFHCFSELNQITKESNTYCGSRTAKHGVGKEWQWKTTKFWTLSPTCPQPAGM